MKQKSWHIDRRELLKGAGGIVLGLPFLNGMIWGGDKSLRSIPKRLVVNYFSYGAYMPKVKDGKHHEWNWWPCANEGPLSFNKSSQPFESLKNYVSYAKGLDHEGGWGLGGHSSGDVFSTGAYMVSKQTTNDISIDQLAAKYKGHETRYPSLVLGSEGGTGSYGSCKTLSHYGPGRPIPALHNPREIFNRLFKPYSGKGIETVRAEIKRETSILDHIMAQTNSLKNRLGSEDNKKMDEYLTSIRSLEKRLERQNKWTYQTLPEVDEAMVNLDVNYSDPESYTRSMYDLIYLALQTDSTRYASFMLESESSSNNPLGKFVSIALGYEGVTHDIAHKRPAKYAGLWDQWRAKQHAYFLNKLKMTKEGDGNMLDRTLVLWGSAHPHGSHSTKNYPIQLAGGNKLGFKHGRLHKFEGTKKVPLANMYLSMLKAIDIPVEKFADSTSEMKELRS
jgi:hypothetical protein